MFDFKMEHYVIIIIVLLLILFLWNCQMRAIAREGLGIVDRSPNVIPKHWRQRDRTLWNPWWFYKNEHIPAVPEISRFPMVPDHSGDKHWVKYWASLHPDEVYVSNKLKSGCDHQTEEIGCPVKADENEEPFACEEKIVNDSLPYDLQMDEDETQEIERMTPTNNDSNVQKHTHHHYYKQINQLPEDEELKPAPMPLTPPMMNIKNTVNTMMQMVNLSVVSLITLLLVVLVVVYFNLVDVKKLKL